MERTRSFTLTLVTGGDECEVSVKEAAEAVMKAMDYDGEMVVSFNSATLKLRNPI